MTATVLDMTPVSRSPYSVDTSKGEMRGDVSKQWMARPADQRFATLTELHDAKKAMFDASWEQRAHVTSVEVTAPPVQTIDDIHRLNVAVKRDTGLVTKVEEIAPTHYSFGQLCQLVGAPAGHYRENPSQLVAPLINYRLRQHRKVDEVKLFAGEEELYAATGPTYGRIPDHKVIEALQQIAGDGLGGNGFHWKTPGKLNWSNGTYDPMDIGDANDRTFYGSDRDMFVFLVDDLRPIKVGKTRDGRDDHLFRGFYVQNSMVGSRSLKVAAFYLRGVCMNRNLWGVEGFEEFKINHTSGAPGRWLQQALPALRSFANGSESRLIEGVEAAKAAQVAEDDKEALHFLQGLASVTKSDAAKIMEIHAREEGAPIRSVWDAAQGITAHARSMINTDDRLTLELEAKKLLDKAAPSRR